MTMIDDAHKDEVLHRLDIATSPARPTRSSTSTTNTKQIVLQEQKAT